MKEMYEHELYALSNSLCQLKKCVQPYLSWVCRYKLFTTTLSREPTLRHTVTR